jgi:hypothetical protein
MDVMSIDTVARAGLSRRAMTIRRVGGGTSISLRVRPPIQPKTHMPQRLSVSAGRVCYMSATPSIARTHEEVRVQGGEGVRGIAGLTAE